MSERMRSERGARSQREIWQREEKLAQSPREFLGETALRLVPPRRVCTHGATINRVRCTKRAAFSNFERTRVLPAIKSGRHKTSFRTIAPFRRTHIQSNTRTHACTSLSNLEPTTPETPRCDSLTRTTSYRRQSHSIPARSFASVPPSPHERGK